MRLKVALKNAAGKLQNRDGSSIETASIERTESDGVVFRMRDNTSFRPGAYTVSNHHPFYHLMPADSRDPASSREQAWASLRDYHEHRDPGAQDEGANRVSCWLVDEVLVPLEANSFLEVGCGAGRNLTWLSKALPTASVAGFDINPEAVARARELIPGGRIAQHSAYELDRYESGSVDVVYSVGVLEHIPPDRVEGVIREMHRVASRAVLHFELHGASHDFDYHRYPRDYEKLYEGLGLGARHEYEVFPDDDYRSEPANFRMALLTAILP